MSESSTTYVDDVVCCLRFVSSFIVECFIIFLVFAMVCDGGKKAIIGMRKVGGEITIKSLLVWREKTWKMHRNSHCNRDLWNRKNIFQINGRREKNWTKQAFVTSEST